MEQYGRQFLNGDRVEMEVDFKSCQVMFSINEKHFGKAADIRQKHNLFAAVDLENANDSVELCDVIEFA